jgi:hypothetical protein
VLSQGLTLSFFSALWVKLAKIRAVLLVIFALLAALVAELEPARPIMARVAAGDARYWIHSLRAKLSHPKRTVFGYLSNIEFVGSMLFCTRLRPLVASNGRLHSGT